MHIRTREGSGSNSADGCDSMFSGSSLSLEYSTPFAHSIVDDSQMLNSLAHLEERLPHCQDKLEASMGNHIFM